MTNIYLYQNYLIKKLTSSELKLLDLDDSYQKYCNGNINLYSKLIESKKYTKLNKKINLYQIELELVQSIIVDMESMCEHMELMGEQM